MKAESQELRTESIIRMLQPHMDECFDISCRMIMKVLEKDAPLIWRELKGIIRRSLEKASVLHEQGKKGRVQYIFFCFMRHGAYVNRLGLYILPMDSGFYLDEEEASENYEPEFLTRRYLEDLEQLYKKASEKYVRMQEYEKVEIKLWYADYYNSFLDGMLESQTPLICKVAEESGICDMNKLVIAYGDYMDRVRVLYKAEEKEKTGD